MLDKIREKILHFIYSPTDAPLLAGFSVGLYMIFFYYAANFSLACSVQQFAFFAAYYVVLPMVVLYLVYRISGMTRFAPYNKHFLFIGIIAFFSYYLIQLNHLGFSKEIAFGIIIIIAAILSIWLNRYYKALIVLLFIISVLNIYKVGAIVYITQSASENWKVQPDNIESITFKKKPNIYYIQPDGYTNAQNLQNQIYGFNNSDFENYLNSKGFKIYPSFRSNYYSTLLSNSSMFAMKHHYIPDYMDPYGARNVIISDNAVLDVLKKNNYKTYFFTERPYLIINRPDLGYDYSNFSYSELPYFFDGWNMYKDYVEEFKKHVDKNSSSGNFYFLESFNPGHISNTEGFSEGAGRERDNYINKLKKANLFLKEIIGHISKKDPGAIIIIAADHGGFVGFEATSQTSELIGDKQLAASMFGAHLSIRWNDESFKGYDENLRSSVNLFRTVFAYLAQDKIYLKQQQDNSSFIKLKRPDKLYRYFDDNGNAIFKPVGKVAK